MNDQTRIDCSQFDALSVLDERMTESQRDAVQCHLASCQECQAALITAAGGSEFVERIRRSRDEVPNGDLFAAERASVLRFLNPTDDPESLGRIGPYEVTGIIGSGAMGTVLKAMDPSLRRSVAVKVMLPHLVDSPGAKQRFQREAQAAAAVTHPNVIPIHCVEVRGALPYLVMPLIRGESLQQRIDRDGPLDLVDLLRIGRQVAAGLAAAHDQGLIHRDLKPANLLVETGTERLKIVDFGLARTIDDVGATRTGIISGTPSFMSPEQAVGGHVDERSDLFSLGSVLYTLASGRSPFQGDSVYTLLHRIVTEQPARLEAMRPDLPSWFIELVAQLMRKDVADRLAPASKVQGLCESCLTHLHDCDRRVPVELTQPSADKRRNVAAFVFLFIAAMAVWIVWPSQLAKRDERATDVPSFDWSGDVERSLDGLSRQVDELDKEISRFPF